MIYLFSTDRLFACSVGLFANLEDMIGSLDNAVLFDETRLSITASGPRLLSLVQEPVWSDRFRIPSVAVHA